MNTLSLEQAVGAVTYPGRGIVAGKSSDGQCALLGYFIMGRSVNSRNRIFVEEGEGLRTQAFDESLMSDPSLIIYHPVRVLEDATIVTNGDQTDTVFDFLQKGLSFDQSLNTRTFEPDAPNFTPRISCVSRVKDNDLSLELSILKSGDSEGRTTRRNFFRYDGVLPGQGFFISTYMGDGNPLPSFEGEPRPVAMSQDLDDFARVLWQNLNFDNKVSLWARSINLTTGETKTVVLNKHQIL